MLVSGILSQYHCVLEAFYPGGILAGGNFSGTPDVQGSGGRRRQRTRFPATAGSR